MIHTDGSGAAPAPFRIGNRILLDLAEGGLPENRSRSEVRSSGCGRWLPLRTGGRLLAATGVAGQGPRSLGYGSCRRRPRSIGGWSTGLAADRLAGYPPSSGRPDFAPKVRMDDHAANSGGTGMAGPRCSRSRGADPVAGRGQSWSRWRRPTCCSLTVRFVRVGEMSAWSAVRAGERWWPGGWSHLATESIGGGLADRWWP